MNNQEDNQAGSSEPRDTPEEGLRWNSPEFLGSPVFDGHSGNPDGVETQMDELVLLVRDVEERAGKSRSLSPLLDRLRPHYSLAPASSSFSRHQCWPGGLVRHVAEVFFLGAQAYSVALGAALSPTDLWKVLAAAVLHDLNKVCDAAGRPCYIPNVLKSGKVSGSKPYRRNPELYGYADIRERVERGEPVDPLVLAVATESKIEEGAISLALARWSYPSLQAHLASHPDLVQAIVYHDGGYGSAKYSLSGTESPLQIAIHFADMASSRCDTCTIQIPAMLGRLEARGVIERPGGTTSTEEKS